MSALSSSLAGSRLHPSIEAHQTSAIIAVAAGDHTGKRRPEVLGFGPGRVEPVGAFEVSKGRRILQVGLAVVYCLLAAGVVFGYAALKPVMVKEGVYRDRCTEQEIEKGLRVCYEQEIRLNFMFTVAAVATNVCALLVGTILDYYGPRTSSIIGSILFGLGCMGFAFARQIRGFDPYLISYLLLALGGPFIFIPSFHLSNAFPAHSGLILSMLTGAFDSSSAVFLLYRVIYEKTGGRIGLSEWFFGYLVVPAVILMIQITLMPGKSYKTIGELVRQAEVEGELLDDSDYEIDDDEIRVRRERVIHEIEHLLGGKVAKEVYDRKMEESHESSGVWGAMHGKPVSKQIGSWWFILITLFTVIQMTHINYFVATIRPQYEFLLHSYRKSVQMNKFFDFALPIGGVLSVPIIGFILDRFSTLGVLESLVLLAAFTCGLGLIENSTSAAITNIILFVIYRPFYYTAISDYTAKVFGFKAFGKVYGLIICIAGLANLSQAGFDALTIKVFRRDPRPINTALLGLSLVAGIALVSFVWRSGCRIKRQRLGLEAEGAEETLMPGGSLNGYGGL